MSRILVLGTVGRETIHAFGAVSPLVHGGTAFYAVEAILKAGSAEPLLVSALGDDLSPDEVIGQFSREVSGAGLHRIHGLPSFYWEAAYQSSFEENVTLKLENRLLDQFRPDWFRLRAEFPDIDSCYLAAFDPTVQLSCCDHFPGAFIVAETLTSPMEYRAGSPDPVPIRSLAIREAALDPAFDCDDIERQLLLHFLSRRKNRVEMAYLDTVSDFVVVDRSTLSNFAYAAAIDERFTALSAFVLGGVERADHIFWIDTPVGICMERLSGRQRDAVELKGPGYFERTRELFQTAVERYRAHTLGGRAELSVLTSQVLAFITPVQGDSGRSPR